MPKLSDKYHAKLDIEIDLLQKQLDKILKDEGFSPKQRLKKYLIDSLPALLVFVSIAVAIITLWFQSVEFLEERKKENEVRVNISMLESLNNFRTGTHEQKELHMLILTQYKDDAIPVFLLFIKNNVKETEYFETAKKGLQYILNNSDRKSETYHQILEYSDFIINSLNAKQIKSHEAGIMNLISLFYDLDYKKKKEAIKYLDNWIRFFNNLKENLEDDSDKEENKKNINEIIKKIEAIKKAIENPNLITK